MVDAVAILGPFREHRGRPRRPGRPRIRRRVRWFRAVLLGRLRSVVAGGSRPFAGARGVPLDLFVFPRKESCTWLATRLTLGGPQPLTVRVAATGQVRLVFDGVDVAPRPTPAAIVRPSIQALPERSFELDVFPLRHTTRALATPHSDPLRVIRQQAASIHE